MLINWLICKKRLVQEPNLVLSEGNVIRHPLAYLTVLHKIVHEIHKSTPAITRIQILRFSRLILVLKLRICFKKQSSDFILCKILSFHNYLCLLVNTCTRTTDQSYSGIIHLIVCDCYCSINSQQL